MKVKFRKDYILIVSQKIVYFIGFLSGVGSQAKGAALFPFIFVKSEEFVQDWLIMHERIHFKQQIQLLFIGSFVFGLFERLYACIVLKKTWFESYLWSSIEQEAYLNMHNQEYLKTRKIFAQFYYIRHKKNFKSIAPGIIEFI